MRCTVTRIIVTTNTERLMGWKCTIWYAFKIVWVAPGRGLWECLIIVMVDKPFHAKRGLSQTGDANKDSINRDASGRSGAIPELDGANEQIHMANKPFSLRSKTKGKRTGEGQHAVIIDGYIICFIFVSFYGSLIAVLLIICF